MAVVFFHDLQQGQGSVQIVAVVAQGLGHGFRHGFQSREVDHRVDGVFLKYFFQRLSVRHVQPVDGHGLAGEHGDALRDLGGAVAEIVGQHHLIAGGKQLRRRMRTDETGAAGKQNGHGMFLLYRAAMQADYSIVILTVRQCLVK